jgi:hypothetical protein
MRMSSKILSLLAGCLSLVGVAVGGCGSSNGSSSGTDLTAVCTQYCSKCSSSGGLATLVICSDCPGFSNQQSTCTNKSAIVSAAQTCANKSTCADSETCFENNIPDCQGASGTGGSHTGGTTGGGTGGVGGAGGRPSGTGGIPGTGGTPGGGGSSGAADCSSCDKANTCCMAIATLAGQSPSQCIYSTAMCNAQTADAQPTYAMTCSQVLSVGAALSASCK